VASQPNCALGRLIVEVPRSHTIRHTQTQPEGLLWTSDHLIAEIAICTTHTREEHPCCRWESKPLFR